MREAVIVVDDEPFSQECFVEALRGSFPHTVINGVASVDDLYPLDGMIVALALVKAVRFPTWEAIFQAVKTLNRYAPKAPVVLISANDEIDVFKAIAAGVQGVVPMTASLRVGVAAMRLVMAGGTYYPRPGLGDLAAPNGSMRNGHSEPIRSAHLSPISPPIDLSESFSPPPPSAVEEAPPPPAPLLRMNGPRVSFTARQADVLALLQKGHSNKWIADHLKLSENTIKVHIQHIMRKLHATNRTEAVVLSVSQLDTHSTGQRADTEPVFQGATLQHLRPSPACGSGRPCGEQTTWSSPGIYRGQQEGTRHAPLAQGAASPVTWNEPLQGRLIKAVS